MLAYIVSHFGSQIIGAIFTGLFGLVSTYLNNQQQQAAGATTQALKDTTVTLKTTQAVAQAEATSPTTLDGILAKLKAGTA